jgi:hypothetical protein
MTHHPQPGPRAVIEAALYDWWLSTDPAEPFHTPAVAAQVETYLLSSGYTIAPNTPRNPPMPTRRSITAVAAIAAICAVSVILATLRGDWAWAAAGTLGTGLLTREGIRDIRDRRHHRSAR